jgi:hypothetical protein
LTTSLNCHIIAIAVVVFFNPPYLEESMFKFAAGVIFGIVISTIGFGGLANIGDKSIQKVQEVAKEVAQ